MIRILLLVMMLHASSTNFFTQQGLNYSLDIGAKLLKRLNLDPQGQVTIKRILGNTIYERVPNYPT